MMKTVIKHAASDQKAGMCLGEILVFVQTVGAEQGAIHLPVKVRTTWRGTIRSLEITLEHDES